jgi:hypothetical protein
MHGASEDGVLGGGSANNGAGIAEIAPGIGGELRLAAGAAEIKAAPVLIDLVLRLSGIDIHAADWVSRRVSADGLTSVVVGVINHIPRS